MPKTEKRPFPIVIYNNVAGYIGLNGKLSLDKILKKAKKNTGLKDLGNDFNDEALKILIKSINEEARLNPFGNLMMREKIIGQLENRLWAEHWFKKYPEILAQGILPIVLITGLQRTGTTKMQRLLSSFPGARPLMSWEALYPAPIKTWEESQKRISRTKRNEKAVKWISPTFHNIHPIHTHQPEEDVLLLDVHFMSSSSEAIMQVPSYAEWLDMQDQTETYEYEKKLLKLLQWQKSGDFWILKSPHHLEYLDIFTRVFPDTKIIWTHRKIEECIPSFLSMLFYSRCMFSDHVNQNEIKSHWLQKMARMLQNGLKFSIQNPGFIHNVDFRHFINNEKEVLSEILQHLPMIKKHEKILKQETTEKYISKHNYKKSDWGLDAENLRSQFSFYENAFSNFN